MHNECVDSQCFYQYFHNLDIIYSVIYKIYVRNIYRKDIDIEKTECMQLAFTRFQGVINQHFEN